MRKLFGLVFLIGCTGDVEGIVVQDTDVEDTTGPEIEHSPVTEPQVYGQDIWLEANVTDADGSVWIVTVEYQPETSSSWSDMPFNEVGGGLFQGRIDGSDVWSGGMRYFLRAIDDLGNESCLPADCELEPWHFAVVPN